MPGKIIVSIADAAMSNDPDNMLATHSLGSCVGVCMYEPEIKFGCMLHYQLPSSTIDPEKAKKMPFMFADTGMGILMKRMAENGANKKKIQIKIAGAAAMENGPANFDIGKRNYLALRKILWVNGLFIDAEDVGGTVARHLCMSIKDGSVWVKYNGIEKRL